MDTIFTKIEKGEIPSTKIYEDDICFVIMDINPVKKGHCLVISRKPYPNMASCPDEVLTHLVLVAKKIEKISDDKEVKDLARKMIEAL